MGVLLILVLIVAIMTLAIVQLSVNSANVEVQKLLKREQRLRDLEDVLSR